MAAIILHVTIQFTNSLTSSGNTPLIPIKYDSKEKWKIIEQMENEKSLPFILFILFSQFFAISTKLNFLSFYSTISVILIGSLRFLHFNRLPDGKFQINEIIFHIFAHEGIVYWLSIEVESFRILEYVTLLHEREGWRKLF